MNTEQDRVGAYHQVVGVVSRLGMKLGKVQWSFGTMATANIKLANKNVARLSFQALMDHVNIRIQPVDPSSTQIMAGGGRIKSQAELNDTLVEIETLFRALLVLKGRMDYYDFPTDAALGGWVERLSEIDSDGEEAWSRMSIETTTVDTIVSVACDLCVNYDRAKALRLHSYVMYMEIFPDEETGHYDSAEFFVKKSAELMSDTLFQRSQIALETGSSMAYLYTEMDPVPMRLVPEMESEMAQSLSM